MRATSGATIAAATVVTMLISSSCGTGSSTTQAPLSNPSATQTIEVDEPFANANLDDLGHNSDLVIRARVTNLTHGITLGTDRSIRYKQYTITRTGKSGPNTAKVFVSEEVDGAPIAVENRADLTRGDEAIWALTELAKEFGTSGYVLTSSSSILPVVNGKLKVTASSPAGKEAATLQPTQVLQRLGSS